MWYNQTDQLEFKGENIMLTTEATPEMIAEWKQIFENHHADMHPNRKTGAEVDAYFRTKYPYQLFNSEEFCKVVESNILENNFIREKLPKGVLPDIKTYSIDGVLVGIDLSSGEFHIESDDIEKAAPIYDDLFVYRGLDKQDLKNFFLVTEYVKLVQR